MKLSLLDKLKILYALNSVYKAVIKMEKLKLLWAKMDGIKSIAGLVGIVAYYASPKFGLQLPEAVLNISAGMAGVGVLHKIEKATGMLGKVLDILLLLKDVSKKTEEKLKEKEGELK